MQGFWLGVFGANLAAMSYLPIHRPILAVSMLLLAACASQPEDGTATIRYACASGGGFSLALNRDASLAQLDTGSRRYSLASRPAESGQIYSDGIVVLRIENGVASAVGVAGGPYRDCRSIS
ncbi:hypothetical protein [Ferrovibrio sp.]|uniref:hypothetical protein n=1 Tax=Ferrovibrio sp. TaxID=1917215 RepID=UPI0035B1A9BC